MNVRLPKDEDINIANGEDIARIMRKILLRQNRLHRKREYFWVIGLSNNQDIEYIELIAIGKSNTVNVSPIDVFNLAAAKKCEKIILCHNHPNGNMKPSEADLQLTHRLMQGGELLGIRIIDHIIICEKEDYYSLLDDGFPDELQ
ncbi:JAB domain-containing protein [Kordia jejudonensis]|uniref:JAB domain-containing protein n=1 Tax=Kordia jejudonensis TaxID=1348245 RepID=UPI000628FEC1|nr:JAB domain-containing protein [Kordia jejudonensis]